MTDNMTIALIAAFIGWLAGYAPQYHRLIRRYLK